MYKKTYSVQVKAILGCLLIGVLLAACSEDTPVQPPTIVDPFAGCGNGDPISSFDSLTGQYPYPAYRISQLKISPFNGWWAGEYQRYGYYTGTGDAEGVFIYDPIHDTPIAVYDYSWGHSWSPDGKSLLLVNANTVYKISIPSLELTALTEDGYSNLAFWSKDGKYIYIRHNGTERIESNGSNLELITPLVWNAKVLDDNRLFAVYNDSIRVYYIQGDSLQKVYLPQMDASHPFDLYDISENGTYIIFQTREDGSIPDPWGNGIWLMDTKTWTPRKIRGAQYWNHQYYPTWASESTFYASVFCRNDSSSMVWEFDLNGNPIRQITTKDMHVWKE